MLSVPGIAEPTPATARETKRVLVLYSLDKGHPAHILTDQGIGEVFRANKAFDVQLFTEYLDMTRFPDPAQTRSVADFLRRKYADLKIDAIITLYRCPCRHPSRVTEKAVSRDEGFSGA